MRRLIRVIYGYAFGDVHQASYRAFTRAFVKTMPVMSGGEIETEISITQARCRWRVADVPIDYRDRPEGSGEQAVHLLPAAYEHGLATCSATTPMAFFG